MRPTLLHFRHPREQTAEYVVPSVTYDGRRLQFSPSFTNKTGSHWGRASRFNNELSRRNVLGPGAYNHQDSPLFKKLNGPRFALDSSFGAPRDSYMYVGDTLVNLRPTERSVACSRRGQSRDMDRSYDLRMSSDLRRSVRPSSSVRSGAKDPFRSSGESFFSGLRTANPSRGEASFTGGRIHRRVGPTDPPLDIEEQFRH
eukprot:TRINITY_DN4268_c0_g1_i5.p1 TRINITY_DN4268_c0_g1~~TRINITY_DN4268_c0_g1_i5.p1  ORF type:complete len:200 (-),score=11.91 TRINITY_DN4268_c0_g1_i5:742-1341(-)